MSQPLTPEQEQACLRLARQALERHFQGEERFRPAVEDPVLREKRGAFVTLKANGELRGCIGYPLPHKPLFETIVDMAVAAATQDYRFDPLGAEDLDSLRIEISVLGLPEPVADPAEVEVGRHGIIVSKGYNRGLLLPQVPLEHDWDRETYLRHGCLKAGLMPDEWQKGVKIEVFTAQVFTE